MIAGKTAFVGELGLVARNNPQSSTGGLVRAFCRQTGQIVPVRRILTADGLAALTAGDRLVARPNLYYFPPTQNPSDIQFSM